MLLAYIWQPSFGLPQYHWTAGVPAREPAVVGAATAVLVVGGRAEIMVFSVFRHCSFVVYPKVISFWQ